MKEFFTDGNKLSMGRLVTFLCVANGILLANIVLIIATLKNGDIGSNSMIVISAMLATGTGSKIWNKHMENKKKLAKKTDEGNEPPFE